GALTALCATAARPLGLLLILWSFVAFVDPGARSGAVWIPLVNPLDLAQLAVIIALVLWARARTRPGAGSSRAWPAAGLVAFVWLNATWLRFAHHRTGMRYTLAAIEDSPMAQSGLSLLWTVTSLLMMVEARRRGSRKLGIAAAVVLGGVVVKLLLVDLAGVGTLARIVSFIGVGALLLALGYVLARPAKAEGATPP
ncbi:MAG: DUF2339 domain-containing protein, partial [Proteobacteria bacterium]|nr:DUF2339 domain-containing protein [Burkholderiales bacterium]